MRKYLQTKLPSYAVPSIFYPLDAMPLTPNGKIDKAKYVVGMSLAFVAMLVLRVISWSLRVCLHPDAPAHPLCTGCLTPTRPS